MPTKRSAVAQKAAPKAKAAKVDPILDEVAPVIELVGHADLSESCKEMLEAMAPHCLKTPDGERSEFQQQVAEILSKVSEDVQTRRSEAVAAAETRIAELEVEQVTAVEALEAANKLKAEQRDVKKTKDMDRIAASEVVEKAKETLETETKKEQTLSDEHKENISQKEHLEVTMKEKWEPLKEGSIPSAQWRERNKTIDAVLKPLQSIGVDGSLLSSLPVALKAKVEERGIFAKAAVEHGEAALTKQIAAFEQQIANFDTETAERSRAVAAAKVTLENAEAQQQQCTSSLSDAASLLEELTKKHVQAQKASKELGPKAKELAKALECERATFESVCQLKTKFQELVERKPVVAEEAPAEDAAPMEVEAVAVNALEQPAAEVQVAA